MKTAAFVAAVFICGVLASMLQSPAARKYTNKNSKERRPMRALKLLLCLLPATAAAEMPVISITTQQELVNEAGQGFPAVRKVVVRGDQIAVLNDQNERLHLFGKQPDGTWRQTVAITLPGIEGSRVLDFDFDGTIVAYTRKDPPGMFPPDGVYRAYATVALDPDWGAYSTDQLGAANGMVAVEGDRVGVSVRRGVDVYRRLPTGWEHGAFLPQSGLTSVSDNDAGPVIAFDGNRILMGTNRIISNPDGASEYVLHVADVYKRDASDSWSQVSTIESDYAHFNAFRIRPFPVFMRGNQLSINGRVFRGNAYDYWEQTADLTPATYDLARSSDFQPTGAGYAVLRSGTGVQDIYRQRADGLWSALARIDPRDIIVAVDGDTAVVRRNVNGTPAIFIAGLEQAASEVPRPASISEPAVDRAAALPGQAVEFMARVWTPTPGAWITGVQARVVGSFTSGDWIPMAPLDGAFNQAFEIARVPVPAPASLGRQVRVCVQVTDSAGHVTELLDLQREPCPVLEILDPSAVTDSVRPSMPEIMVAAPQISRGEGNVIYAFADDSSTPEGSIRALHFQINQGTWRSMMPFPGFQASDFAFGSAYQAGQGILPPTTLATTHDVCVRAVDGSGNVSAPACTHYEVTP